MSSFRRMPDKSAWRVERPEGGPQDERSESSRAINKLDPGLRRGDDLFRISIEQCCNRVTSLTVRRKPR